MHFKLIVAFVEDNKTDEIMEAARDAGATGCTVINNARGEGIKENKTFFGLTLSSQRDVVLLLVEEHLSRHILEHIGEVGQFDAKPGTGIAVLGFASNWPTSTVTVPLVAALGVGLASSLRERNPMTDGFGLIAFASLTPILFVLVYGIVV